MYNTNEDSNDNITPYRASGNLNTSIGNPSMQVNDAMNMNIQSVNTASVASNEVNNVQDSVNIQSANVQTNVGLNNNINSAYVNNASSNVQVNNAEEVNNNSSVIRKFVSNNESKKKKITIKIGPEIKIALLIVVVLLVFVFLLPVITSLFRG